MLEIRVALGARSYSIQVAYGIIDSLNDYLPNSARRALVTTPLIYELYGEKIRDSIHNYELIMVPDGDEAKKWDVVEELLGKFMEAGLDRKSMIIALGGGSVGDLAGFAAAIYMRGISVVQVPTTLLAMVDSAIGGKTAVNHPLGKNLVGSFHQPAKVIIDPVFLETLPEREIRSGLSEVIKYGIISDLDLFEFLETKSVNELTIEDNIKIIARCVEIKAQYVEKDEEDRKGIRAALNYGHTVGHTIETLTNHNLNHGEAVAVGMVAAAMLSKKIDLISDLTYLRIVNLIEHYGLPTKLPSLIHNEILEVMHRDKKAEQGYIRFVLPMGIGIEPVLRDVEDESIKQVLEKL
jgi:3-dehydroquinate synthase